MGDGTGPGRGRDEVAQRREKRRRTKLENQQQKSEHWQGSLWAQSEAAKPAWDLFGRRGGHGTVGAGAEGRKCDQESGVIGKVLYCTVVYVQ